MQSFLADRIESVGSGLGIGAGNTSSVRRAASRVLACLAMLLAGAQPTGAATIVELVGDADDFGHGGSGPIPVEFYNKSGPGDLGVFDLVLAAGDEVRSWTHDFTDDPAFGPGFSASSVLLEIPENFLNSIAPTIEIDGRVLRFFTGGSLVSDGVADVQSFLFLGAAAAFADDGVVNVTFRENGDDVALDYSRLTVEGAVVPEPSSLVAVLGLAVVAAGIAIGSACRRTGQVG